MFGDLVDDLDTAETAALCALTYFPQPLKVEHLAASAGAGSDESAAAMPETPGGAAHAPLSVVEIERALGRLAERALVVPGDEFQSFTLPPGGADFLREKKPAMVAEIGDRLEKRAFEIIVVNGYGEHDLFPALEAAWPGIAPALALFLAGDNARLQIVCDALVVFLDVQGRWDESLALFAKAEARAVAASDHERAGWRAYNAGWIHSLRQQSDAVLTCADRAAAHWEKAFSKGQGSPAGALKRASAMGLRGLGHQLKRDYPAAIAAYREALDLHRSFSAQSTNVAIDLNALADVERLSGDLAAAEGHYREALRVARTVGYDEGVVIYTGNLADLALYREDWPAAETLAREALSLPEAVQRPEFIATDNHPPARDIVRQWKAAEALPHARLAVSIFTRLRSPELTRAQAILAECERVAGAGP
jgi:tetratricopeptide (TPR) repeat protein